MKPIYFVLLYFFVISLIAVVLCIVDKRNARRRKRRISEKTLFAVAICGGAAAMYITMLKIRHKTLHKRFMIGLPLIILFQAAIILIVLLDKAGMLS